MGFHGNASEMRDEEECVIGEKRIRAIGIIMSCVVEVLGCGYRFSGGGRFPAGIKSVFVEVFENNTSETGIEQTFTNDLISNHHYSSNRYATLLVAYFGLLKSNLHKCIH